MLEVPSYEEFKQLREDVAMIREENEFLRRVVLAKKTLTRHQVLKVLDVSTVTLWRLTTSNALLHSKEGKQTVYDVESVRSYLMEKKVAKKVVENKLIDAFYTVGTGRRRKG